MKFISAEIKQEKFNPEASDSKTGRGKKRGRGERREKGEKKGKLNQTALLGLAAHKHAQDCSVSAL